MKYIKLFESKEFIELDNIEYDKLRDHIHFTEKDIEHIKKFLHPKNMKIYFGRIEIKKHDNKHHYNMDISKLPDDYFIVKIFNYKLNIVNMCKCDQINGLKKALTNYL